MSEKKTAVATEESQSERYAVIGVRWYEVFPELVVAYRDEESLRELIAAPCIIGIGFGSREAALTETRRIACAALQHAIAAGVLMFYSKSVIAAAVRAFVGA